MLSPVRKNGVARVRSTQSKNRISAGPSLITHRTVRKPRSEACTDGVNRSLTALIDLLLPSRSGRKVLPTTGR